MPTRKNKQAKGEKQPLKIVRPSGKYDSNFFELVHEVARQIPYGKVTSYGAIAACLGAKSASRMVGWAMNNAHTATPPVPAHRVVNRNGLLTGKHHFPTETAMQEQLEKEGVRVENDKIVDWEKLFWTPGEEL